MPNYQLQVLFDRENRIYRSGEEVSGRVVLDTQASLDCRKIWIEYGWRTHGKGNEDKGGEGILNLCLGFVQFRAGEHREYPFRFKAPIRPLSYRGQVLNVDWYVNAHMDIPRRLKINKEQDFLLISSETLGEVVQSTQRMYELPRRSNDEMVEVPGSPTEPRGNPPANPVAHRMIWSAALIISILALDGYLQIRGNPYHAVIAFLLFPIIGVVGGIYSWIAKTVKETRRSRMFEVCHLWMSPAQRYPGDWVICRLQFQTKRNVYLDNIAAELIAEEVAVSDDGSTSDTYRRDAYKQSFAKSYTENLSAGRLTEFSCDLPVLPGAPVTFSSTHNSIDRFVIIKMTFKGLPAWEKTVPITVLPFKVSAG